MTHEEADLLRRVADILENDDDRHGTAVAKLRSMAESRLPWAWYEEDES